MVFAFVLCVSACICALNGPNVCLCYVCVVCVCVMCCILFVLCCVYVVVCVVLFVVIDCCL